MPSRTRSRLLSFLLFGGRAQAASRGFAFTVAAEDRKSTRLNSSHQIISYAVFCLKKKTILRRSVSDEERIYDPRSIHQTTADIDSTCTVGVVDDSETTRRDTTSQCTHMCA